MQQTVLIYLKENIAKGAGIICSLGFTHFHHAFVPRLLEAGKDNLFDRELLAKGWLTVAQVYWTNRAPNRAEQMLQKSLASNKDQAEVYHLLAQVQSARGEHFHALGNVDKALNLVPDEILLHHERQRIQDEMNYGNDPQFIEGDLVWKLNELLAEEQFESVINTVLETDMDGVEELKCLARAFGAVGHNNNFMRTWDAIKRLDHEVDYDVADLFFMPVDLKE